MIELPTITFTLIVLFALGFGWYSGWKRGHVSGHWCERDNAGEKRFDRGEDYEP